MSTAAIHECEVLARKVAILSSLAAAVVFGVGFATDRALSYHLVIGQAEQIGFVLLVFVGYWIAWSTRFEAIGSVVALAAVAVYWTWCRTQNPGSPQLIFLVVAAPALIHLAAVTMHRLSSALDRHCRVSIPAGAEQAGGQEVKCDE